MNKRDKDILTAIVGGVTVYIIYLIGTDIKTVAYLALLFGIVSYLRS